MTVEGAIQMRAVRPNPLGAGAPWVVSTALTDEDIEELFGRHRWPRCGLRATLAEAKKDVLAVEPERLDPEVRARIVSACCWQELVRAVLETGSHSAWVYALHKATGLHVEFLEYIAQPYGVPGPFVFWIYDDDVAACTAAWPWEGIQW